jgi:tetratricopeptide (TPR) repeat protein
MLHPNPPSTPLVPGTVVAGRFTIHQQAGRGGMGSVYRASDAHSGRHVALKQLHSGDAESLQRFSREAHVLASLRHPGIVSYVAHGADDDGRPFLAMEWLEGESLAQRLARQPLSLEETLTLLRNASRALAGAHQHGVIHRDLKPSNLFLRDGRPADVVLLDFGLARHTVPSTVLTASQMVLGTPGYMAPEQVSCQSTLTPSADLFSLGCVLYECLTGQPPFSAPHLVAALAKILFTEPVPLSTLRPELPGVLQELLEHLLAKDPARRPPEASSLLATLERLQSHLEGSPTPAVLLGATPLRLAHAEQHLVSVLLASPRAGATLDPSGHSAQRELLGTLRSLLVPHGAQVELLTDGSLVATVAATHGSSTDPATLVARCALLLQERWPEATVVLTTGRGRLEPHLPMGEAMDRAGQLLRQRELLPDTSSTSVLLDEVTAGLLGSSFQLDPARPGLFLLLGESLGADASRPLLGKPTPCVGREQELTLLELAWSTCAQESVAQAVLVKAPAGTGKSRLRHEFLRRLERHETRALVLLGRGDPLGGGSTVGLLGQALRRLCDLSGAERLARHLPPGQGPEVVSFLGELCGISLSDAPSPKLRAARGDPRLMNSQLARALVAFLRAECAHHPVLLVLEDLHWGDQLSLQLLEVALRELAEQPLMVVALARPEVDALLPAALKRRLQEVSLRGLSRKAGARLVREVLGPEVPESVSARLVEQAAGNALFLEELIRGVAEGRGEAAPETVLAMLQARLGRLEPGARQVLLAASFLGRTFWSGGVRALLGEEPPGAELEHRLRRLVEEELVELQPDSRFPTEDEYRFRHALVRDAAHGLVLDSHKPVGHRLAGQWLERAGESDPRVLAEHASLGQQPERAVHFYTRAAEQLFERYDMPAMEGCVKAALAQGVQGQGLLRLRALQGITAFWMGDVARLFELGPGVLAELGPGSKPWCWRYTGLYMGSRLGNQPELAARLAQELLRTQPQEEARVAYLDALSGIGFIALLCGIREEAAGSLARLAKLDTESTPAEASLERCWHLGLRSHFSFYFEARPWRAAVWAEQSCQGHLEVGSEREATGVKVLWALALEALGDRAGAEEKLRESLALAQRVGPLLRILYPRLHLGLFLAGGSEPARWREALELASGPELEHVPLFSGLAWLVRAKVAANLGNLAEAEAHARRARDSAAPMLVYQLSAWTLLSQVLLARGRATEAREVASLGVRGLERCGGEGGRAVALHLALAEACLAEGDTQAGEEALRRASRCLLSRAEDISDPALRERFLHEVPENARVLELTRQREERARSG